MKIERRGKYAGIKLHLDADQVRTLIDIPTLGGFGKGPDLLKRIITKVKAAVEADPTILQDRTPEEIKAELTLEMEKSRQKLAAMGAGEDWTKVKVE